MIRYKGLGTLYIFLSATLQINSVQSQWNGEVSGYGQNYVPCCGGTPFVSSPIQYVPIQGSSLCSGTNSIQSTYPVQYFDQYSPNGPYLPFNSPIYCNTPDISYQGLDQANVLRSAYPNQPIIIINNGGNGDTGGNSNNGNDNGRRGNSFNFGDLAAILLATRHRSELAEAREGGPELRQAKTAPVSPPIAVPQEVQSRPGSEGNKCSTVTQITIVLPSSGGTVSVERKNKDKEKKEIRRKKDRDSDEENDVEQKKTKPQVKQVEESGVNKDMVDIENYEK